MKNNLKLYIVSFPSRLASRHFFCVLRVFQPTKTRRTGRLCVAQLPLLLRQSEALSLNVIFIHTLQFIITHMVLSSSSSSSLRTCMHTTCRYHYASLKHFNLLPFESSKKKRRTVGREMEAEHLTRCTHHATILMELMYAHHLI